MYLTALQVSERYGVTPETVWRWARTGVIPKPIKIASTTRWVQSELDAMDRELKDSRQ